MQEEFIMDNPERSYPTARKANTLPSEELIISGRLRYQYVWDWAKLPKHLKNVDFRGVAWDKRGFLFAVANVREGTVAIFDREGNYVRAIGDLSQTGFVHGISINQDGYVWLTSLDRHVALLYDREGNLIQVLGQYDQPSDSGVNDSCAPCRWRWNTIRRLAGPFHQPTRIIEDTQGDLFASDGYGNAAIHHFNHLGVLQQTWGGMGKEPGKFTIPHSLWIDKENRIFVADCEADRVQVFAPNGLLLACLGDLLYPMDVTSDDRLIYVAEREGRISIYDYRLKLRAQLGFYGGGLAAHGLAADDQNNLYFSSLWHGVGLCKLIRLEDEEYGGTT